MIIEVPFIIQDILKKFSKQEESLLSQELGMLMKSNASDEKEG